MTTIGAPFSGGGGLEMAVEMLWPHARHAWHAETDPHAITVHERRWPGVPNLGDLRAVDWTDVEPVDVIVAGYPCQPWSTAGRRKGADDDRDGWPWLRDAIRHLGPRLVLLENVRGHVVPAGAGRTIGDLADLGYDAVWTTLRASDVGAPHRRERWFCAAYPAGTGGLGSLDLTGGRTGPPDDGDDATDTGRQSGARDRDTIARNGAPPSRRAGQAQPGRRRGAASHADGGPAGGQRSRPRPGGRDEAAPDAGSERAGGHDRGLPPASERTRRSHPDVHATVDARPATSHPDRDGLPQLRSDPTSRRHSHRRDRPWEGTWGDYQPAIERWENVLGRHAPAPRDDRARLNPAFVEWMMGWPDQHVGGIPRTAALRILGNGAVPLQAAVGWNHVLTSVTEVAA